MAKSSRKIVTATSAKPAQAPAVTPVKPAAAATPVAAKPASKPATIAAVPVIRGLSRATRVIDAARYPREHDSDADMLYLSFFAAFAKRGNGKFTIAETLPHQPAGISIRNNPARALRLTKAGFFTVSVSGNDRTYTATPLATSHKLYASAKPFAG